MATSAKTVKTTNPISKKTAVPKPRTTKPKKSETVAVVTTTTTATPTLDIVQPPLNNAVQDSQNNNDDSTVSDVSDSGSDGECDSSGDGSSTVFDTKIAPLKRGRKPKYLHTIILTGINARDLYRRFRIGKGSTQFDSTNYGFAASGIMEYADGALIIPTGSSGMATDEYIVTTASGNEDVVKGASSSADVLLSPSASLSTTAMIPTTTSLFDISGKKAANMFIDAKTMSSSSTTFVDYLTFGSLPYRTDCCCWHDRHPFSTSPIGCPIRYVEKALDRYTQTSQTSLVEMTPTPSKSSMESGKSKSKKTTKINTNDYYLTIGTFCSFPCVLAHINANQRDPLYKDSKSLLYSLYYSMYGAELKVDPANSWQCLKSYGGNLTIEEFRRTFCTCNYVITPDIKRPYMVSVGKHIEEHQCGYL